RRRGPGRQPREPGSAAEVAAVAGAEPEAHEVAMPRGIVVVHVGGAAVDHEAIVEELDLAALEPEVEPMGGILKEGVHAAHRLRAGLVEHPAGLLVATEGVARVESRPQPAVPGEYRPEIRGGGVGGLILLMVAIEDLVQALQQM